MILNPYMTGAEVLRIVLRDFGLVSREDLRRGALATADVPQLLDTLEGFLRSLVPIDSHAVIVSTKRRRCSPHGARSNPHADRARAGRPAARAGRAVRTAGAAQHAQDRADVRA